MNNKNNMEKLKNAPIDNTVPGSGTYGNAPGKNSGKSKIWLYAIIAVAVIVGIYLIY